MVIQVVTHQDLQYSLVLVAVVLVAVEVMEVQEVQVEVVQVFNYQLHGMHQQLDLVMDIQDIMEQVVLEGINQM
tara:strand:+ start:121 stop:342 length:222 start_codon:yes stop_codon:yes gene_type:complete